MKIDKLAGEIGTHIAERAAELERQGLAPEVAARKARIEFGSIEKFTEHTHEAAAWPRLESWARDLRLGLRALRRSPGFTAAAVLMLALGIGANTAIFSMVDWLLLRPLAVPNAAQLTYLMAESRNADGWANGFSYPNYRDIRQQSGAVFTDMAGVNPLGRDGVTVDGTTLPTWTNYVTGNFFNLLGVRPALGRLIAPADDTPGAHAEAVMVISYPLWQSRFGGRTDVIGRQVAVDGRTAQVIGVAPRGFSGAIPALDIQAYLPVADGNGFSGEAGSRGADSEMMLIGQLRPGVSLAAAQPVLAGIGHRLAQDYPKDDAWSDLIAVRLTAQPPSSSPSGVFTATAAIFLSLAGLVLLLACVNLANLLLVRADTRRREFAVRAALGAGRARLARQLLLEAFWVAVAGGLAGLVVALGACRALDGITFGATPVLLNFGLSWRVLGYAAAMTLVTVVAIGIAPALRSGRVPLNAVLQQSRGAGGNRQRVRTALVACELSGSLMLLVVAGLFYRSLNAAQTVDLGFQPQHVLNVTLDPHEIGMDQATGLRFYDALLQRVRRLPGVRSASFAWSVPMGPLHGGTTIKRPGQSAAPGRPLPEAGENTVSPAYFDTMGIALLRGRGFTDGDSGTAPRVAVINQVMAQKFWPRGEALGQVFALGDQPDVPVEVVGIAANSHTGTPSETIGPYVYLAQAQYPAGAMGSGSVNPMPQEVLQVRTAGAPMAMASAVESAIHSLAPTMPILDAQPMTALLGSLNGLGLFQLGALMAGAMGLLGLLLAGIGVFGVVSYAAAQRTHEIGVRVALGARRGQVLTLVLRQAMWMLAIGLGLGLLLAAGISLAINPMLVGVSGRDPLTYVAAALALGLITLAASLVPALRAMRADPIAALRCE